MSRKCYCDRPFYVCAHCCVLPAKSLLQELREHDSEMSLAAISAFDTLVRWVGQAKVLLTASDSECSAIANGRPPDRKRCAEISATARELCSFAQTPNGELYIYSDPQDI
jgi:hypothetical protein